MKSMHLHIIGITALLMASASTASEQNASPLDCLDCHVADFSEPIQGMLESNHWNQANPDTPGAGEGCRSCHGASTQHRNLPTQIQPDTSFGPRWTNAMNEQNGACLSCHADTSHADWADGKHASEQLTCVTCHDLHREDLVRTDAGQQQVCTVCHKVQKEGVHSFGDAQGGDPPCAQCHDPHGDPAPQTRLLASRSEGCRACHDLQKMSGDPLVSESAKSYHKVMVQTQRTCIDCHRGVIHSAGHGPSVAHPEPGPVDTVGLFFPGQTSIEWLRSRHPGAQPLQQGRNCRQCHQGEAQSMGEGLGAPPERARQDVEVAFQRVGDRLNVSVSWQGASDRTVSVLFDDGKIADISQAGCFAACHNDMAGMSQQRDQGHGKYLSLARRQERSVGRPALMKDPQVLAGLRESGQYAELWLAEVRDGSLARVESFTVLETQTPDAEPRITATARGTADGMSITFSRPLDDPLKPIVPGQTYTIGVAVHDLDMTGAQHWVSLPLTLSLDGSNTDFLVAP